MKITVGVSTYGMVDRVNSFMMSFWNSFEESQHEVSCVCVDDGTSNLAKVRERERECKKMKFTFIPHGENRGIPAAWNTIINYAAEQKSEVVIIFNDDIYFIRPGWISQMAYFFEKNDNVGTVGFPLVNEKGFNDRDSRWLVNPGVCGAAVGCAFGARPEDLLSIENPDGSRGYWEDLISFHEEVHMGFKLAEKKKFSFMLPWPPVRHWGGQTFQTNANLTWRQTSPYLPMDTFLSYSRSSAFYIDQCEEQYSKGFADRMMYSRAMFCKYWGILDKPRQMQIDGEMVDIWNEPQKYVHSLVVPKQINQKVGWINKSGKVEEAIL